MNKKGQLVTWDEAPETDVQHTTPCSDCPWARRSLRGWLGSMTGEEWLKAAHSESMIDCHALRGPQCAGAAIYRANMSKIPRDPQILKLRPNRGTVFSSPNEFLEHHECKKP